MILHLKKNQILHNSLQFSTDFCSINWRCIDNNTGKGKGVSSARSVKSRMEKSGIEDVGLVRRQSQIQQHGDHQLSFLGALAAQRALRRFKLNLHRFKPLCKFHSIKILLVA